jgi:T-complex protein 1 subunit delta
MLDQCQKLLSRGIHPTIISDAFQAAAKDAVELLEQHLAIPIDLSDTEQLVKAASTSLSSKVVAQYAPTLAPLAVAAVLKIKDNYKDNNVDLHDIKIVKKLGGTLEDTELIDGLCLPHRFANDIGSRKVEKAKIGLIQFCISPPKTDMDNQVVISDYAQMDRVLKEERNYILNIVKTIKKSGCNVLFIQKSILRDALNEIALHFLAKLKIAVIRDIEREDIEFVCKTLGCRPIASLDHFTAENLASADIVEEMAGAKIVRVSGIQSQSTFGKTVNILLRGSNKLVIEEAERSIHDALCVVRCLVRRQALIPGGGAPEIELSIRLQEVSRTLPGLQSICYRAFADALEIIPFTLSENAGLNPIQTVTELRQKHAQGEKNAGINVRKGRVTNILEENVLQPFMVTASAITLAAETVRSILKIDDIVMAIR